MLYDSSSVVVIFWCHKTLHWLHQLHWHSI